MSSVIAEDDSFNIIKNNRYVGGESRCFTKNMGMYPEFFIHIVSKTLRR